MPTVHAAWLVLALDVLFLAVGFGWRSWLQYRRTGSTGFRGVSGALGSIEWVGGVLFAVALVGAVAAPVLALAGVQAPIPALDGAGAHAAGLVLFAAGFVGTVAAQLAMGDAWRIGVDVAERTTLVTGGPFRVVRNPIFTCMITAAAGLTLLLPTAVAVVAWLALVVAIEIQVRLVEERHLLATQGAPYVAWAAETGRFLPGVGLLRG